jgi:UDP-N-acetylglucosamine--N-acetylmuramyl-(pentapeptide) pyrophosphoryl-undecaprenol N-acetylglucosamine transferase
MAGGAGVPEAARRTALFAAGGTGGHIWPAVAVARALEARGSRWRCHFVAGDRPVEIDVYRTAGIEPITFHVPHPGQGRWRTWLAMPMALIRALWRLLRLRPHVILSTGGYVAAPVAVAARIMRIPTVLLEPNAIPGRVTRHLAGGVAAVALADPRAGAFLKARRLVESGNPLVWRREELDRPAARAKWGVDPDAVCVLVVGGSQGANALNDLVMALITRWGANPPRPVHLVWATGIANEAGIRQRLSRLEQQHPSVRLHGHLWPLTEAFAAADLVLSRAGAGAVADLAEAGRASVLLPLPIALDDHQRANAQRLVEAGGAVIFDERKQGEDEFVALVSALVEDEEHRESMAKAAAALRQPEAATQIAELMENLATPKAAGRD